MTPGKPSPVILDLKRFLPEGQRILAGFEEGKRVRKELRLDQVDRGPCSVRVLVPEDLISLNISYFRGLFGLSIHNLGGKYFREKYAFEGRDITTTVDFSIREAERTENLRNSPWERDKRRSLFCRMLSSLTRFRG